MKALLTLLLLIYLGSIPARVWVMLSPQSQQEVAMAFAADFLGEREYCEEVAITVNIIGSDTIFPGKCEKFKT